MSALDLIGRVATRRLLDAIEGDRGRAFFCIMGLDAPVATALARHVMAADTPQAPVEVFIHPGLVSGDTGNASVSDITAPWHRNHARPGVRLTLCSVPADDIKAIGPTLAHNEKVDDAWLLQDLNVWVREAIDQSTSEIQHLVRNALAGALNAHAAHDVHTVANFLLSVRSNIVDHGHTPDNAVRGSLPSLRLPKFAGDPSARVTHSVDEASKYFSKVMEENQPALYLKTRDGDPLNVDDLRRRLKTMVSSGDVGSGPAGALEDLINDRTVYDGSWTKTQQRAAELGWEAIEGFFSDAKRKAKPSFGMETLGFFERQFPNALAEGERALLNDLAKESRKANASLDAFFSDHRARLQSDPKLYKRWERLVFRAPIETDDLADGLLRLAHRAVPESERDDADDTARILVIRLRNSEKLDFWTKVKNRRVLRYLRDRYRGLRDLLQPHAVLEFGRCWSEDWDEYNADEENFSIKGQAAELEFEAYLVTSEEAATLGNGQDIRTYPNRAQMTWRAPAEAIGLSLSYDVRAIRPKEPSASTSLLSGRVRENRSRRAASATGLDLKQRTSISDAHGNTEGWLANPSAREHRVDLDWLDALSRIELDGIVLPADGKVLRDAFQAFHSKYGQAIEDLLRGPGIASASLFEQAELYGSLLSAIQRRAPQPICIQTLLAPLLSIGIISVDSEPPAALVAPWQPLRLAEMAAKTTQLAADIVKIVTSSPAQRVDIQDFVEDRTAKLKATFYADVAAVPGEAPQLLAETQVVADCSLAENVTDLNQHGLAEEPADVAVQAFERVAKEYLDLHPHEQSNFSVLIFNADSENLPLAMSNSLARSIEDNPDLRCELVVTDEDPVRLREVYERQNRRISSEMDASLATDAAKNLLSRLRLGILGPESLRSDDGLKTTDITLLQDVIARNSKLRWVKSSPDPHPPGFRHCTPTDLSRRRPFKKGNTSSALYLTSPKQPSAGQAYVNALYAITEGEVVDDGYNRLPVQEVEFQSGDVARILQRAHGLGTWVMTFDRVADRRLVTTDQRRIIRYFSPPGSTHNVIVSAEITEKELSDHIDKSLNTILPGLDHAGMSEIRGQLFRRAAKLSGGVVMRSAQWGNYAHELLGLVLSQCELEQMLTRDRPGRTGWFFLDDYRQFLSLTGEIADILAINFSEGPLGREIRLSVVEAKYVSADNLGPASKRSSGQLESTYTALHHRLLDTAANLAPSIWRNRLADMVLEHMDAFDHVGGWTQEEWLDALRAGTVPIKLEGFSLVFAHDLEATPSTPAIVDEDRPVGERRLMAQWVFGRPATAKSLRGMDDAGATQLVERPAGWGTDLPTVQRQATPEAPPETGDANEVIDVPPERTEVRVAEAQTSSPGVIAATVETKPSGGNGQGLWKAPVLAVLHRMSRSSDETAGRAWLDEQIVSLRSALQLEGMDAPILDSRLTPNTGLAYVGGRTLTVSWLERKQTDFLTRYGLDIVRITPMPGRIVIGLRRPTRAILHLADAWLRRDLVEGEHSQRMAPLLGEREDDGGLSFLPLGNAFRGQESAAPHSLISGTTGSGKGILVTNVILDLCALNGPSELQLFLIDPKRGVDYAWARRLPQLRGGIIDDQEEALALLERLVGEMETRYDAISAENVRNIDHYNRKVPVDRRMPRIAIIFDEVANWMQDDDFKSAVDGLINKIATKSRAAGFHLFMIYQRADNQVMTMQLRTNLGNKLILRLGDEGSSRIALGERGAERLLGKGHLITKLGTDEKTYLQVPYIGDDEVDELAEAVISSWLPNP